MSVRSHNIDNDAKVSLPEGEMELGAEGRPIEAGFGIKMPKFKGPDIRLPSFKGKVKCDGPPSYDAVVAASSAYAHPKCGADVDLPDAEVELDNYKKPKKGDFKMPKFRMPGFGTPMPKFRMAEVGKPTPKFRMPGFGTTAGADNGDAMLNADVGEKAKREDPRQKCEVDRESV